MFTTAYLGNIIIFSNDWQQTLETGKTHSQPKEAIGQVEVWYLSFHLDYGQVHPQIDKTAIVA